MESENKMVIYNTRKELIALDEFVELYGQIYYYLNRDLDLENRIDEILFSDHLNTEDIIDIMRWKSAATGFSVEDKSVRSRWGDIDLQELADELSGIKRRIDDNNILDVMTGLLKHTGIGPVYAVTLLYFISKGAYPIYDRFAHKALIAIQQKRCIGETIADEELNRCFRKDSVKVEVIVKDYLKYRDSLFEIFPVESPYAYCKSRAADKAMWTYGHLF